MKQYVWMAAALVVITGVNASENPFDLNKNLQKIDVEQQRLLQALKKEASTLEAIQEAADDAEIDAEDNEAVQNEPRAATANKVNSPVQTQEVAPKEEVVKLEKIADDQAKLEAERVAQAEAQQKAAEEKAKQEREALAKLEAEREAATKREQEAELARLKAEKTRLEQEAQAKAAAEAEAAKQAKLAKEVNEAAVSDDINITREEMEAAKRAEEELKQAIAEVDQDD